MSRIVRSRKIRKEKRVAVIVSNALAPLSQYHHCFSHSVSEKKKLSFSHCGNLIRLVFEQSHKTLCKDKQIFFLIFPSFCVRNKFEYSYNLLLWCQCTWIFYSEIWSTFRWDACSWNAVETELSEYSRGDWGMFGGWGWDGETVERHNIKRKQSSNISMWILL